MTTYKEIKGFKVQSFAQDPVPSVAGWSSGSNMPLVLDQGGAAGTTSAVIYFGGTSPPLSPATQTTNIQYDGSSWTTLTSMPQRRAQHSGFGLSTAAIAASGEIISTGTTSVESWDGSSWTSTGAVSEQVNQSGGTGIQTAGFIAGGYNGPKAPAGTAQTQEYNGSTWSLGGNLPSGRYAAGAAGTQTAGVMFGGTPTLTAIVNYDGSSWTTSPVSISSRAYTQNSVHGNSSSDAAIIGGYDNSNAVVATDFWNGTAITTGASIATASLRGGSTTSGATTGMYKFGGGSVPGSALNSTEEYNDYSEPSSFLNVGQVFYNTTSKEFKYTNQTFSASWASSGSLSTSRAGGGVARSAPQTASLLFGGYVPPGATAVNNTEEYNGSSWTAGGALPGTARNCAGAGTQTAGLFCGGIGQNNKTYEYDGSTWTAGGDLASIAHSEGQAAGLQTAAFIHNASYTEEYNGSSWTAGGAPVDAKIQGGTSGTLTAGISFGGEPISNVAETYNGTSWTAIPSMNNNRQNNAGFGTTSSAVSAGGGPPPNGTNVCEVYNGASWSTTATLNTARSQMQGSGTSSAGMVGGGWTGSVSGATENFEGADETTHTLPGCPDK